MGAALNSGPFLWSTQMIISYLVKDITAEEIWPLEEVKNYLRISHKYDDNLIQSLNNLLQTLSNLRKKLS